MPMEVFDAPPPGAIGEKKTDAKKDAPAEHPWVQANRMAREGKTPTGENIGTALAKPLVDPESIGDYLTGAALTTPLIAAGGAGAGVMAAKAALPKVAQALAPALGRLAVTGGIGVARGHPSDTAFGVLAESLPLAGRVATKVPIPGIGKIGGPAEAIAEIKRRIGTGPDGPVNLKMFDALIKWWRSAPNEAARDVAGDQVAKAIANTKTGLGDWQSYKIFKKFVQNAKISPEGSEMAVAMTRPSNAAQATTDALVGNTPFGAAAALALPSMARHALPHGARGIAREMGAEE